MFYNTGNKMFKKASDELFYWFAKNQTVVVMKWAYLSETATEKVVNVKNFWAFKFNNKLNFYNHMDEISKNEDKLNALSVGYVLRRLGKLAYIFEYSFSYCPLGQMFHSRGKNDKINHLRIIYNDKKFIFRKLLEKYNCFNSWMKSTFSCHWDVQIQKRFDPCSDQGNVSTKGTN